MRCGTAAATGNQVSTAPSSASGWNQWTAIAQSTALEHRPLSTDRHSLARAAAEAQRELLEATVAAEQAVARAHALSRQLELVLDVLTRNDVPSPAVGISEDGEPWVRLSPREREVLALVAEGRSNKAIAEALYVSPNTVKTHVAALLTKLEVETRVQLAALAARHANLPQAA